MYFPKPTPDVEPYIGQVRSVRKFAWLPVTIASYGRTYGTVWLEHYTERQEFSWVTEAGAPPFGAVWCPIGTYYPAV